MPFGECISEVQRCQNGDAFAGLDFSCIANRAHLAVDIAHRCEKRLLSALGAAEDIALTHNGHFHLFHRSLPPLSDVAATELSPGSRSSRASIRPRAAFRRDLRLSRSCVI